VDRALQDFARVYQLQPDYVYNLSVYAFALTLKRQYGKADSLLQRAEKKPAGGFDSVLKFSRAFYFAALGKKEKALALNRWPGVLAELGMKDAAISAMTRITANQEDGYLWMNYLPLKNFQIYDSLRDDARFRAILKKEKRKYEERINKYSLIETN